MVLFLLTLQQQVNKEVDLDSNDTNEALRDVLQLTTSIMPQVSVC